MIIIIICPLLHAAPGERVIVTGLDDDFELSETLLSIVH